jgi:hypothetical protein
MFSNQPYSLTPVAPASLVLFEPFCKLTQEFQLISDIGTMSALPFQRELASSDPEIERRVRRRLHNPANPMFLHVRILPGSRQHRKREDSGYDKGSSYERKRLQHSRHALYCSVHHIQTACRLDLQEDWNAKLECHDVSMGYRRQISRVSQQSVQADVVLQQYVRLGKAWSRPRHNSKRYDS